MDPMSVAALIGAGSQVGGGLLGSLMTGRQNRRSMDFSREMYERQYRDAIEFWNMQNAYNAPIAQMNRFTRAGLNPNLIYGQGNSGNAGSIPVPSVERPQFDVPPIGQSIADAGQSYMNAIYDLDIKATQKLLLDAQINDVKAATLNKNANTARTITSDEAGKFDLGLKKEVRSITVEGMKEALRKQRIDNSTTLNRDAREAALNSSHLKEAVERMLTMQSERASKAVDRKRALADIDRIRKQIEQMDKDGRLKDIEISLREKGINPQDPMWARVLGRILSELFESDLDLSPTDRSGMGLWWFLKH